MADKQNDEQDKKKGRGSPAAPVPQKAIRQVVLTHLDAPPPSGKERIHPRRPAPVVPTREQGTVDQSPNDRKGSRGG